MSCCVVCWCDCLGIVCYCIWVCFSGLRLLLIGCCGCLLCVGWVWCFLVDFACFWFCCVCLIFDFLDCLFVSLFVLFLLDCVLCVISVGLLFGFYTFVVVFNLVFLCWFCGLGLFCVWGVFELLVVVWFCVNLFWFCLFRCFWLLFCICYTVDVGFCLVALVWFVVRCWFCCFERCCGFVLIVFLYLSV